MPVTELWIYPIKSCGGIRVARARVGKTGFELDRAWMLMEGQQMLTQRENPKLAQFRASFEGDCVRIEGPSGALLLDPKHEPTQPSFQTAVWYGVVEVVEESPEASRFFTGALGRTVRLVRFAKESERVRQKPRIQTKVFRVGFADGAPFLLTNEGSLRALQQEINGPLPMNRFRPNIVVSGCGPFEEDTWQRVRIGEVELALVKPCSRCEVTTIDQSSTARGKEPLRTLATFRRVAGSKVMFGMNVIPLNEGQIRVGDQLEVFVP